MRVHLQLLDAGGTVLAEGTYESPAITISPSADLADLRHADLCYVYEIATDGYHATIRSGKYTHRLRRKNLLLLPNDLKLRVDLYPHPDAVPVTRDACPSCGGVLRSRQVAGAYRSVAREERRCDECQTVVLRLDDAPATLGLFTDHRAADWVLVTVPQRCPRCSRSMLRSVLHSAHGEAEVERCEPCGLVVIEPEDEARLVRAD